MKKISDFSRRSSHGFFERREKHEVFSILLSPIKVFLLSSPEHLLGCLNRGTPFWAEEKFFLKRKKLSHMRSFHGSPKQISPLVSERLGLDKNETKFSQTWARVDFFFLKRKKSKIPQDIIGNIAILKFPRRTLWLIKKLKARKFLKENKTVTTVVEKTEGFSGKLRILKTKHLAGIKTKKATYKENQCTFKFNIDESYFSPRLSNERKIVADEVVKLCKKKSTKIGTAPTNNKNKSVRVLVMFAGIAPYPIIIAKKLKQAKKSAIIISNELNKKANESAKKNIVLNKLQNYITLINGDAKKLPTKMKKKFNIIIMPRPNLKDTFLKTALKLSKKGTIIFYHGFGTKEEVLEEIKKDTNNKIGKIEIRKAGDIGAYKFRWQASFKVR